MFRFKLSNNSFINNTEIDGYMIAGIVLEGINIQIKIDANKNIISYLKDEDIKTLEDFPYQTYLKEASELAKTYIRNKDFSLFLTPKNIIITDIVDNQNHSFYWHEIIKKTKYVTFHIRLLNANNLIQNAYIHFSKLKF